MPAIHIATETLIAIERAIERDQGNSYRGWLGKVLPHIGDAYRSDEEPHRSHMGASLIGGECARHIWYNFRWATRGAFSGTMLRLFNRGHLEEGRFIACLLTIGVQVIQQDENGKQFRISHAEGHFGGSGDGVGVGIPDLTAGMPALLEFKTHNDKSFTQLAGRNWKDYWLTMLNPKLPKVQFQGEGVRLAKFEHYVQAQQYMRKMGLAVCLYMAVNKDNDLFYGELIPLDTLIADQFLERAERLIYHGEPPKRISETPGYWKCRYCDDRPVCHLGAMPDRNCRTCKYSEPVNTGNGAWECQRVNPAVPIDKARQLVGCEHYTVAPYYGR